jgi:hypothetical protein
MSRHVVWWWAAGVAAAASMLVLHSGAYASRRAAPERLPDLEGLLRARERMSVAPPPEDAGLLRQRYEALQERRRRIGEALPERLRPDAASPRPPLRGAGVIEPPRMDSGDANPDGVRFLPAVDGPAGGGQ